MVCVGFRQAGWHSCTVLHLQYPAARLHGSHWLFARIRRFIDQSTIVSIFLGFHIDIFSGMQAQQVSSDGSTYIQQLS